MNKNLKRKIVAILLSSSALAMGMGALTSCGSEKTPADKTAYSFQYNKPFTDAPDAFMTIDGKLDEDAWKAQRELVHCSDGVETRVSTVFTQKGLYIGAIAYDPYVYWNSRNDFANNSTFRFRVAGPKEVQSVDDLNNNRDVDTFSHADFHIDYLTCRSYRQTRFNSCAYVDGEINLAGATKKNETKSLSVEIFLTWEELKVDVSEYESGIPDSVRLYSEYLKIDGVNQTKVNAYLYPMNAQGNRMETWFQYTAEGLSVVYDSDEYGNGMNGPAATDQWTISETDSGTELTTGVNRTQTIWFKADAAENFEIRATVKPGEINDFNEVMNRVEHEYPHTGFMMYKNSGNYSLFVMNCREMKKNNQLNFKSASGTDGLQYIGHKRFDETIGSWADDTIDMRVVKCGTQLYYFYRQTGASEWIFWNTETVAKVSGAVYAGLFTNGAAQFINPEYYVAEADEFLEEMKAFVYYVNLPDRVANGTANIDKTVLKKGDTVTINLIPNSGAVLTELYVNDDSMYEFVDGQYMKLTPTDDMVDEKNAAYIQPVFTKFANEDLQKIQISFVDAGNAPQNVSFHIEDENHLIYYKGTAVGQGKANISLPKGEVSVGGRTFPFTGKYTLTVDSNNYYPATIHIDTKDTGKISNSIYSDTLLVKKIDTGNVTVNGIETKDGLGTIRYNEAENNHYITGSATANGWARGYYLKGVLENFVLDVAIENVPAKAATYNVPGLVLSAGASKLELKASPYDASKNALYANIDNVEIALMGFANTITTTGGEMRFTAVRYNNVLFLYNVNDELMAVMASGGIGLYNGCTVSASEATYDAFMTKLAQFFATVNKENAIGMVSYWQQGYQGTSYFDFSWNTDEKYIEENYINGFSVYEFEPEADGEYSLSVKGIKIGDKYLIGAPITISLKYNDGSIATQIALTYGSETEYVDGVYNVDTKRTTFTVYGKEGLSNFTVSKTAKLASAAVSIDVGDLFNATSTMTFTGTKNYGEPVSESWTGRMDANGCLTVEDVSAGSYQLKVVDGMNVWYAWFDVEETDVNLTADDFTKDIVNMSLQANTWKRQDFVWNYSEEEGIYYTLNNPANGVNPNQAMYTYAPFALEKSNKITVSYDVTVEKGGPLGFGISLGAHRSEISNGTSSVTPWSHIWFRLNKETGKYEWSLHYDYQDDYNASSTIVNLCWPQALPTSITGFGDTFNVKIVRDNGIVAFFIDGNLVFYLDEAIAPIVNGYTLGDTPLYYAISVRAVDTAGKGSAKFTNITATNTADLSKYFTTVSGSNNYLNADSQLTVFGVESISGRNITLNLPLTGITDTSGNFSFKVPYGQYDVSTNSSIGRLDGTLTANSGAQTLKLSGTKYAEIGAVNFGGIVRDTSMPTDATYSEDGQSVTFSGVSTGLQHIYTLKNTYAMNESFTYEATIKGTTAKMSGVCVMNGGEQIGVSFAPWEDGSVIIQAAAYGNGGNDFVLTGVDDVIDANNQINATVKFVQTYNAASRKYESLAIYVNNKLVCTLTSAGFALGEGISYKTAADQTAAEAKDGWNKIGDKGPKYLTRPEFACGFTGYMTANDKLTYTVNFTTNS